MGSILMTVLRAVLASPSTGGGLIGRLFSATGAAAEKNPRGSFWVTLLAALAGAEGMDLLPVIDVGHQFLDALAAALGKADG